MNLLLLYNFLIFGLFIFVFPYYWLMVKSRDRNNFILKQRLGLYNNFAVENISGHFKVWIHASSVGEVKLACRILDNLKIKFKDVVFVLSTATVSGNKYAKEVIKDRAIVILAPLDLYFCIRYALLKIKPDVIVYVETEIWPNWINLANNLGITTLFLNGRISKRSVRGYNKVKTLMKFILDKVDIFSMSSDDDRSRIISIGAPIDRVFVNGNAKFDLQESDYSDNIFRKMYILYNLFDNPPVFVAGSIRSSEESIVIDAYVKIRVFFPDTILIIAPRHINRVDRLEKFIRCRGISCIRKTSIGPTSLREESVVILDTIGDLIASYSVATVVFCGASLVDLGGQNIIEAAIWAKPVIHGPFMNDFQDIVDLFKKYKASIQVNSGDQLAEVVSYLLGHTSYANKVGKLAREIVLSNMGAIEKHTSIVGEFIEKYN